MIERYRKLGNACTEASDQLGLSQIELNRQLGTRGLSAATMSRAITVSKWHSERRLNEFVVQARRLGITEYIAFLVS